MCSIFPLELPRLRFQLVLTYGAAHYKIMLTTDYLLTYLE